MLALRKIAVTGGISAGKSTVCQILKEYGAYVVDADAIVHNLLSSKPQIRERVVALLGPEIIIGNQISRKKISEIVFSNPKKLNALEAILHPAVKEEIERQYDRVKTSSAYRFFVAEVPLLYEAQMENDFDTVLAVLAEDATLQKRCTQAHFDKRKKRQLSSDLKAAKAHFTIYNNGDLAQLRQSIQNFLKENP